MRDSCPKALMNRPRSSAQAGSASDLKAAYTPCSNLAQLSATDAFVFSLSEEKRGRFEPLWFLFKAM